MAKKKEEKQEEKETKTTNTSKPKKKNTTTTSKAKSTKKETKKEEAKEETKKEEVVETKDVVEEKKDSKKKSGSTKTTKKTTTKKKETTKTDKKTTKQKEDPKETKKEKSKKEPKQEKKEEVVVKEIKDEDQEEKLSQTFIERTKKFIDESNQYVENAIEEEELEKTRELENTQIIRIREALKPIGNQKKKRRHSKNSDIDEDFLDVNNKGDHLFLKLILIVAVIAIFIWLMPKIAEAIDKNFILDNDYTPYVPEEEKPKDDTVVTPEKEEEPVKSEKKLTEEEVKALLDSIESEKLMLPTSTKDYTLEFADHTMNINSTECYIIDVYAIVNEEYNYITGFAVSVYGDKIFKMNTNGGYEKIDFSVVK